MKAFLICFLMLFEAIAFAQSDPYPRQCISTINNTVTNIIQNQSGNCGNSSPYYGYWNHQNDLYLPQPNDDIIYIKLNFIFLTKPDGTGNFEQNNPEHVEFIDNMIANFNNRLGNLEPSINGCESFPQANYDTRIRVVVNKIWRVDPAWDFLYTGYNPSMGPLGVGNQMLYPPSSTYYYTYLDNDPNIPEGINMTFANNGQIYSQYQNGDFTNTPEGWAASEFPYYDTLNRKLRQFYPDLYNGFLHRKHYVVGNPQWGSPTWETVKLWYAGDTGGRGMVHELGHNFALGHHDCGSNIMSYSAGSHNYLSKQDVSIFYQSASITSIRQYFTQTSFKNTNIITNTNQLWDLNFRIYSNVKVTDNSSLKATCKIIMSPESRIIVKSGSNFIIEGADISSANNLSWNGIKIEGNGYGVILPDTQINNGYFLMYTDNTILPSGKITNTESFNPNKRGHSKFEGQNEDFEIYPNPTGDFINIKSAELIKLVSITNLEGRNIKNFKSNLEKIDVQSLPSGIYLLRVELINKIINKKFIKK